MAKILSFTVEVSDQEFATFMERIGIRANPTNLQASTALPNGAGKPAESDEADDDEPATGAVAPAGVEVDASGAPHNPAVHASTKGKTAEGYWKRLKGVSKEAYDAYAAPYIAAKGAPAAAAPAASGITVPPLPGAVGVPGLPPMAAPVDQPVSYEQLVKKFQDLASQGKSLDAGTVTPIYQRIGLSDINQLQTNETLRGALMKELNAL